MIPSRRHTTACRPDTAPPPAKADVPALLAKLAEQNPRTTKGTSEAPGQSGEPRLVPFLKEYYMKSSAYVYQDKVVLKGAEKGGIVQLLDPLNLAPLKDDKGGPLAVASGDVKELDVSRRELGYANAAVISLQLAEKFAGPDASVRLAAVQSAGDRGDLNSLPLLRAMLPAEKDKRDRFTVQ